MEGIKKTPRFFIAIIIGVLLLQTVHAQVHEPVKWSFVATPINKSEASLIFTVSLEDGWHIYSQFVEANRPRPTTITFKPSDDYSLIGNTQELFVPVKGYSELHKMNLIWFEKTATFSQKVKVHSSTAVIKGKIEFMLGNDEEFLPPEQIEFSLAVKVDEPEMKIESLERNLVDTTKTISSGHTSRRKEDVQNALTQSSKKPSPIIVFLIVLICFSILTVMLLPFLLKPRMPSGSIKTSRLTSFFLITGRAWRAIVRRRN